MTHSLARFLALSIQRIMLSAEQTLLYRYFYHRVLRPTQNRWGGFCHHGNVLFPMWHRAYVQHLENALRTQVCTYLIELRSNPRAVSRRLRSGI